MSNVQRKQKKYVLDQIPEAFYNDIEDIDERPRIEVENGGR
jgi:magnesium transporter